MPSSCCAVHCTSRYSKCKGVKLYWFPRNPQRLAAWIQAIRRDKWQPTEHSRLCGLHFISGKPSHNEKHPDYIPTVFAFNRKQDQEGARKMARYERLLKRRNIVETDDVDDDDNDDDTSTECVESEVHACEKDINTDVVATCTYDKMTQCSAAMCSKAINTDVELKHFDELVHQVYRLEKENESLHKMLADQLSLVSQIRSNDKKTHFYTGFPSYDAFSVLLSNLSPIVANMGSVGSGLSPGDELLLVLI